MKRKTVCFIFAVSFLFLKNFIMAYTQRTYSQWAKTTPRSGWAQRPAEKRIPDLYKLIILGVLAWQVWGDSSTPAESFSAEQMSLLHPSDMPMATSHQEAGAYIERFAPVAKAEMRRSGIPASIILAQAILESQSGKSALATKANNHFGIKCFSSKCHKGHCMNFSDDSHKDFFLRFPNAWSSFRAHSNFLKQSARYKHLFKHHDYHTWAKGLANAGYATDKQYGEKLIRLIESLHLHQYDDKA